MTSAMIEPTPNITAATAGDTSAPSVEPLTALIARAADHLASAKSAAELLEAQDMAGFAYDAAKRVGRLARMKRAHDTLIRAASRAQAHALLIEIGAKVRLADEYDRAQQQGEVAKDGRPKTVPEGNGFGASTAQALGLSRKQVHEGRALRDAEATSPGIFRRTLQERLDRGEAPTKAVVRRVAEQFRQRLPTEKEKVSGDAGDGPKHGSKKPEWVDAAADRAEQTRRERAATLARRKKAEIRTEQQATVAAERKAAAEFARVLFGERSPSERRCVLTLWVTARSEIIQHLDEAAILVKV
jgi:hypothetical protein